VTELRLLREVLDPNGLFLTSTGDKRTE